MATSSCGAVDSCKLHFRQEKEPPVRRGLLSEHGDGWSQLKSLLLGEQTLTVSWNSWPVVGDGFLFGETAGPQWPSAEQTEGHLEEGGAASRRSFS